MKNKNLVNEEEILKNLVVSDALLETVVSRLNIDPENAVFRGIVFGSLKRQTKDQIILCIWQNLGEEQLKDFKDFSEEMWEVAPRLGHEDLLMQYALLDEDLMKKIHKHLSEFFKKFIERFNELNDL